MIGLGVRYMPSCGTLSYDGKFVQSDWLREYSHHRKQLRIYYQLWACYMTLTQHIFQAARRGHSILCVNVHV